MIMNIMFITDSFDLVSLSTVCEFKGPASIFSSHWPSICKSWCMLQVSLEEMNHVWDDVNMLEASAFYFQDGSSIFSYFTYSEQSGKLWGLAIPWQKQSLECFIKGGKTEPRICLKADILCISLTGRLL